jgi:hypothetical protein
MSVIELPVHDLESLAVEPPVELLAFKLEIRQPVSPDLCPPDEDPHDPRTLSVPLSSCYAVPRFRPPDFCYLRPPDPVLDSRPPDPSDLVDLDVPGPDKFPGNVTDSVPFSQSACASVCPPVNLLGPPFGLFVVLRNCAYPRLRHCSHRCLHSCCHRLLASARNPPGGNSRRLCRRRQQTQKPPNKIFIVSDACQHESCHLGIPLARNTRLFIVPLVVSMNDSVDVTTHVSGPAFGPIAKFVPRCPRRPQPWINVWYPSRLRAR